MRAFLVCKRGHQRVEGDVCAVCAWAGDDEALGEQKRRNDRAERIAHSYDTVPAALQKYTDRDAWPVCAVPGCIIRSRKLDANGVCPEEMWPDAPAHRRYVEGLG